MKLTLRHLGLASAVLFFHSAGAQSWAASGLYQILSGSYSECCGIGGDFRSALPSTSQTFVRLTEDPQSHVATMTFLGEDARTVFGIVPCPRADSINFTFFGFVAPDGTMIFHVDPFPPPDEYYYFYTVTNSANNLRIDGTLVAHRSVCVDVPDHFTHSNVVAVLVSPPVVDRIERDGNSILFHLTGPQLYDYTVEFTDSLASTNWSLLASYHAKLGPIDVVVTNSLTSAQARFFRVRQEFCYCRNE